MTANVATTTTTTLSTAAKTVSAATAAKASPSTFKEGPGGSNSGSVLLAFVANRNRT